LAELRAQTAALFGSALEEDGHDEEAVTAAKAAWLRDPETAAQAIAGCSIEEAVSAAGCNQYKHKPGCPEAEGGDPMKNMTNKQKYELFRGAWASAVDKNTGETIRFQITALQADAISRWGVVGVDDGRIWFMNGGNKHFLEDRTAPEIKTREDVKSAHESSIEDLLVGDLVQAAGCNQYKHKPGCPEAEGGAETDYEAEIEKTRKKLESANEDKHKKQKVLNRLVEEKEMYNRWAFEKLREGWSLEKINEDFDRQMAKVMPKIEQAEKEFNDAVKEWQDIGDELSRIKREAEKRN
jgi:hypothetical protein